MDRQPGDSSPNKLKDLKAELSDAGSYSYAAICAISLNDLFGSEYDMPYSKNCIKKFVKHMSLPKQVFETMDSLVSGYGSQSYQAYVELLMSEPAVKCNPVLVIQDLVMFAIETGQYDARSRVLVLHVASLLGAPRVLAQLAEESLGHSLLTAAKKDTKLSPDQQQLAEKKQRTRKFKRYALIGLATVGGGALLGVTGGLAAPLIGAGIGTIIGGGAAAAAIGSVAGAAIVGSLFGLAGAGLTGYRMKRRVGEIEQFEFCRLSDSEEQLHIAIAVSGWLDETDDNFERPWRSLHVSREQYFLKYETTYLRELGSAMDILVKAAMSSAVKEVLKHTLLRGLLAAIAWPASLLSLSHIIDNPWGTCLRRSAQVGRHLAEVLMTRQHGGRPVSLVGFSLGARVIFYCLRELADRMPGSEGIVQDAVMLGAPVTGSVKDWTDICSVVAGSVVNGYCRSDWLLKFLYRTTSVQVTIAGLNPIECQAKRLRNVDLSEHVSGHQEYTYNIDLLLKIIGVRTCDLGIRRSTSASVTSGQSQVVPVTSHSVPAALNMQGSTWYISEDENPSQSCTEEELICPDEGRTRTYEDQTRPEVERTCTNEDQTFQDEEWAWPEKERACPDEGRTRTDEDQTRPDEERVWPEKEWTCPYEERACPEGGRTSTNEDQTRPEEKSTRPEKERVCPGEAEDSSVLVATEDLITWGH